MNTDACHFIRAKVCKFWMSSIVKQNCLKKNRNLFLSDTGQANSPKLTLFIIQFEHLEFFF